MHKRQSIKEMEPEFVIHKLSGSVLNLLHVHVCNVLEQPRPP